MGVGYTLAPDEDEVKWRGPATGGARARVVFHLKQR
jgi:hypothetical protein